MSGGWLVGRPASGRGPVTNVAKYTDFWAECCQISAPRKGNGSRSLRRNVRFCLPIVLVKGRSCSKDTELVIRKA